MKIERELYIKSILFNLFGFSGVHPYSSTYKQLNILSKIVFKKPIYKHIPDYTLVDVLLLEAKKRNFGYAEYFLRKWKIQLCNIDLPDSTMKRIGNLDIIKQRYIYDILLSYDEITKDNICFIFDNPNIDFYTASIIIDTFIESIFDIHDIVHILSEIDMQDKELIIDYICDYISDFSRRDMISEWNLNSELNDKIILLDTFDFFMIQLHINKKGYEINQANINEELKNLISDILLENYDRPLKKLRIH